MEKLPVVVMAALGSSRTFDAVCTITDTCAVMPSFSDAGGSINAMVTGYVTTLFATVDTGATAVTTPFTSVFDSEASEMVAVWCTAILIASASAKLATTSRDRKLWMVTSDELVPELVDVEDDPLVVDEPPPLTVWPTVPFTAVTVPLMRATNCVCCCNFSSW